MSVSWNDEYDCNELANRIEQSKTIDANGRVAFRGFEHAEYVALLYSMLQFSDPIPEVEMRSIIWQAVSKAGEKGGITAKSLLTEVNKLESSYLRQPSRQYVLVTTVSVRLGPSFPRIRINDATLTFGARLNKTYRESRRKIEDFSSSSPFTELPDDYTFVKVNVSARAIHEAAEKALNTLDLVRGMWNWFYNRQHSWRWSSPHRSPVNKVILGPIHTLHLPNGKLATETWWYETKRFGNQQPYNMVSDVAKVYKFVGNVRKKLANCKYQQVIEDAIVLYTRALDEWDWDAAFLKLWSVLEQLTDTEESYKVTIRRASFVFEDRNYYQQVLRHLKDYRNRFVHEAADSSEVETYMYQLKNFVETLLGFHLANNYGFQSLKEACDFLDLPSDKATLSSRIAMMKYAQRYLKHV